MDAQDVAFLGHLLRGLADLGERLDGVPRRGSQADQQRHVDRQARAIGLDADLAPDRQVHAERLGAPRHLLADVAEAEHAERLAVEAVRLGVLLLVPLAGPQVRHVVGNAAIERQDEAEGQLGDGHRVLAGAVGDVDAAGRRARDVDVVVAGARAHDEGEPARVEHRLLHLGRADDQHVGSGRPDRLDEGVVLQVGLPVHVAPEGREPVEPVLLELVRDEDLHEACPLRVGPLDARNEGTDRPPPGPASGSGDG